jgi:hypothetical protein
MACERPDEYGRSLAKWDCQELARQLKADGIVASISPDTVGRICQGTSTTTRLRDTNCYEPYR